MALWLTEEEARAKACPQMLGIPQRLVFDGNALQPQGSRSCIGSGCMAWRWAETHIKNEAGDGTKLTHDTYGFCGLAGFPNPRGDRRMPDMELQSDAARVASDASEFARELTSGGDTPADVGRLMLDLIRRLAAVVREIA